MSLQGTLDTFALPDVLRLLAATGKTGHLRIEAEGAGGSIWVDAGHVVAASTDSAGASLSTVEVLFELLRATGGRFDFQADLTTSGAGAPSEIEPLLEEAEELLAEWREIEAVVPSLAAHVMLAGELPAATVTVSQPEWRLVVAVGSGTTVGDLGRECDMGELAVSRAVKGLVEAGLVTVATGEDESVEPGYGGRSALDVALPPEEPSAPTRTFTTPDPALAAELGELAALASAAPSGPDAPELARQLAQLGPEAARAVAAAAQAETPEEREAALANLQDDDEGEPINRGLLLKFLSSVRS